MYTILLKQVDNVNKRSLKKSNFLSIRYRLQKNVTLSTNLLLSKFKGTLYYSHIFTLCSFV